MFKRQNESQCRWTAKEEEEWWDVRSQRQARDHEKDLGFHSTFNGKPLENFKTGSHNIWFMLWKDRSIWAVRLLLFLFSSFGLPSFYVFFNKLQEHKFSCNEEDKQLFLKDASKKKRCYKAVHDYFSNERHTATHWITPPPSSYVEALTRHGTVFGDRAFRR